MFPFIIRIFRQYFGLIFMSGLIIITSCKGTGPNVGGGTEAGPAISKGFASADELEVYIKDEFSESAIPSNAYSSLDRNVPNALLDVAATAETYGYSQTNVQEAGVDEADKIKTDGTYLYVADNNAVHIVNAVPADSMNILSTIDVNGAVDSLYLNNNTLVILYRVNDGGRLAWTNTTPCLDMGISYCTPVKALIGVLMIDVSDPSFPEWIREWTIDGWMVSSRLTNGKLHLVQKFFPDLPPLQVTYDGTEEGRASAIAANELAMESVAIDDLVPYYSDIDVHGDTINSAQLILPVDFYHPEKSNGGSIVSIVTFDLDNPSGGFKSIGLIADAHTVYASTQALYIASTQWNYNPGIAALYDDHTTFLYKFALTEENVTIKGTGSVDGKILNQFSMSEYNDVLRIATTTGNLWGETLQNNLYCLRVINDNLEIIGKLEGLAPGENIYSARFIGTRGFLVTFVKVDPLFTIDLSNPYNPTVVGELKVPGYSDYIHPLGDNHLITIGKDTKLDNGTTWYQGLQLSIFDVSDFSDPQLIHSELIGDRGTKSEALDNHKAFTFWAEKGLLAIPVDLYEHQTQPLHPYSTGTHTFSGLYVYRVTIDEGFEYLGRINTDSYSYYGNWLRGVFIGEDVYAVNEEAVRSANIDDISGTLNILSFPVGD